SSLLSKLIRLLLARTQRLFAFPESDQPRPTTLSVDQGDGSFPAFHLACPRKHVLLRVPRALIDLVRWAFERADPRRLRPLTGLIERNLVHLDRRPPAAHL